MVEGLIEQPAHSAIPDDGASRALARLLGVLGEDAIFVFAAGANDKDILEALAHRRASAYAAAIHGQPQARMLTHFDAWVIDMVRAMAPLSPPGWIPMMGVVREKVTLEVGARGLRSLFSNKPSERDIARIKRCGSLATRTLRAVFAADGPLDAEEITTLAAVVAAFGLPEPDATALLAETPIAPETLDVYGELDHGVARAIVRGAWLAAAADGIDPREEHAIRVVAHKTGIAEPEVEAARREAQERVEARSKLGAAAVDGIRYVLSDLHPGLGVRLAALVGTLTIPRRWRGEALASVGQGAPVTLAGRHVDLAANERFSVLGIAWAAALIDDPTVARRAVLQSRWERFARDLGEDDLFPQSLVEQWIVMALATWARSWA
jgi:tellurite resistance protein